MSTFAGTAGVMGQSDGQGPAARFNHPGGIALDMGNFALRQMTPSGVVTTENAVVSVPIQ